jgi:hypothetical protein
MSGLTSTDICRIIKSCSEHGVNTFEYQGIKVSFDQLVTNNSIDVANPIDSVDNEDVTNESNKKDSATLLEDHIAELMITDPVEYERMVNNGEIDA